MGPHHLQGVRKSDRNAFSFCNFFFFFFLLERKTMMRTWSPEI